MKKLIVTDFDGTLIDEDEAIAMSTVLAIDNFRNMGNIFAIATGRIPSSVITYNKDFNFIDYVIACNGSYIYDLNNEEVIFTKPLDGQLVRTIKQSFEKDAIIYFCSPSDWHLYISTIYTKNTYGLKTTILDFNKFLSKNKSNIYKIEMHYQSRKDADFAIKNLKKLKLEVNCNLQIFNQLYLVEITPKGIDKYEGIRILSKRENIKIKDTIAIGDSYNDIKMVKKVGYGVAVENACEELKEVAKEITSSNNCQGVEKIILKNS